MPPLRGPGENAVAGGSRTERSREGRTGLPGCAAWPSDALRQAGRKRLSTGSAILRTVAVSPWVNAPQIGWERGAVAGPVPATGLDRRAEDPAWPVNR
jgi:hypothetical protein